MTSATLGQWQFLEASSRVISGNGTDDPNVIADLNRAFKSKEEVRANGLLIAAASDLLNAMEHWKDAMDRENKGEEVSGEETSYVVEQILRAVAKARGEAYEGP